MLPEQPPLIVEPPLPSHRMRTFAALRWSFLSQGAQQLTQLALTIVLARLLAPGDFGLVAMIAVFTGFGYVIRDLGLASAIVQARVLSEDLLSTTFWVTFASGIALCGITALAAPLMASVYGVPALVPLTLVISLDFVLGAAGVVPAALLQRNLDFRKLTLAGTASAILAGAAGIIAAVVGLGVWSLVVKALTGTAAQSAFLWFSHSWRPRRVWRGSSLREVISFVRPLVGIGVLDHATQNVDNLLIGRFVGAEGLGLYGRAYALMLYPVQNVSHALARVLFPAYASIQGDRPRTKATYLRTIRVVALITFPLMFGMSAIAEPFTLALFGGRWQGMIPLVRILAMVGALQSISALNGTIFLSQGATGLMLRAGGIARLVVIGLIVLGLRWGAYGVAVCYLAGTLVTTVPLWYVVGSLIDVSVREIVARLAGVFIGAAVMAVTVAVADGSLAAAGAGAWVRLVGGVTLGATVYALVVSLTARQALADGIGALREASTA